MTTVLSPSGIELPDGGDPHSRAQVDRNFTKINDLWNLVNKVKHAEYTAANVTATTGGSGYEFGTWTATTDSTTQNNTFSQNDTSGGAGIGRIKILEAGVYSFHVTYLPTSNPGNTNLTISRISDGMIFDAVERGSGIYGNWEASAGHQGVYLAANDVLKISNAASNAGVVFSGRFCITKLQG